MAYFIEFVDVHKSFDDRKVLDGVSFGVEKGETFAILGLAYFIAVMGAGFFMKDPPQGFRPAGWNPSDGRRGRCDRRKYNACRAGVGRHHIRATQLKNGQP